MKLARVKTGIPILLLTALAGSDSAYAASPGLQQRVELMLAEQELQGAAWVLLDESGEATVGTAGMRDGPAQIPFTAETRFHVGSLAKVLLATGVLRLATEGHLDLDAAVTRYLPDLFPDKVPAGFSEVTIRHLLDHTSGLNDAHLWQIFSEHAAPAAPLQDAFPDPTSQLKIRSTPGARFSYSNMGYALLGMVIEAVVGEPYENYLDQRLLAPLHMESSTFGFTTQSGANADPDLAWGHIDDGSHFAASAMFLRPAGQFTTTAGDLGRIARFLLSDGRVDRQPFIDASLMGKRGKPLGTEAAANGLVAGYGLGLARRDRHGVVAYCHGGNTIGFVAMLCLFPGEGKAFAYSVNTDSETANYGVLDKLLIEALGITEVTPPTTATPAGDLAGWHGWYVLSPNRFQMFEYLDVVFGALRVAPAGDALTMSSLQADPRQLRPVGPYLFSANDRSTTSHVFLRGAQGERLISDGFLTYEKVSPAYLGAHWFSMLLGLAGLLWVLVAGIVSLLRYRSRFFKKPLAPAALASMFLLAPVPLFLTQSFMALGDRTPASFSLAFVTLLLPLGMLATVFAVRKARKRSRIDLLHGIAAGLVLQWSAVLAANTMLPFRLWA
ncbi:MAG: serine hydrolase domain-containing protein [Pseudomonadota bacterium]